MSGIEWNSFVTTKQPSIKWDSFVDFSDVESGSSSQSSDFANWYKKHADDLGLDQDPFNPLHQYDYEAAFKAGAEPDENGHWPSVYKKENHPNRFIDGIDTITGKEQDIKWDTFIEKKEEKGFDWRGMGEDALAAITTPPITMLLPKEQRRALGQVGGTAGAGAAYGLAELGLRKFGDLAEAGTNLLEEDTAGIRSIGMFPPGTAEKVKEEIQSWIPSGTKRDMQETADERMKDVIDKAHPLMQPVLKTAEVYERYGVPAVLGFGTGGLTNVASGVGRAGLGALEGILWGVGDNPEKPFLPAAIGGTLGVGGAVLANKFISHETDSITKATRKKLENFFLPEKVEESIIEGKTLFPKEATGDVVNIDIKPQESVRVFKYSDTPDDLKLSDNGIEFDFADSVLPDIPEGKIKIGGSLNPSNPLVIVSDEISAGAAVLKKTMGDGFYNQFIELSIDKAKVIANRMFPSTNFANINSMNELVDMVGRANAKELGHDAIFTFGITNKNIKRGVALDPSAIKWDTDSNVGSFRHPLFTNEDTGTELKVSTHDAPLDKERIIVTHGVKEDDLPSSYYYVEDIESHLQGAGGAKSAYGKLLDYSDATGIPVVGELMPRPGGLSKDGLRGLKERLGFTFLSDDVSIYRPGSRGPKASVPELKVSFSPDSSISNNAASHQVGSIPFIDRIDEEVKAIVESVPGRTAKEASDQAIDITKKLVKTRTLKGIEKLTAKWKGKFATEGTIGGLKKFVSFALAKAEQLEQRGIDAVGYFQKAIGAKHGIEARILQELNDAKTNIENTITNTYESINDIVEVRELITKAVTTRNPQLLVDRGVPQHIIDMVDDFQRQLTTKLPEELIKAGVPKETAQGIVYRGISYLHRQYLAHSVDFNAWMDNRAIEDPEGFKKAINYFKNEILLEGSPKVKPIVDGVEQEIDQEALTNLAIGRMKAAASAAGDPTDIKLILQKQGVGSADVSQFKTTQGNIESNWTEYLKNVANDIRDRVSATLPDGTEIRPDIDSAFEGFLSKQPEFRARRIRNRYVRSIYERAGQEVPDKVDYNKARTMVNEEMREFLFREAIREEDTPEVLVKFLGANTDYIEAATDTIALMAHNVSVARTFRDITDEGFRAGVLSDVKYGDWVEVTNPLRIGLGAGYEKVYAPGHIADILSKSVEAADNMHAMYILNNRLKAGKIISVAQTMRNLVSATWQGIIGSETSPLEFGGKYGFLRRVPLEDDIRPAFKAAVKSVFNGNPHLVGSLLKNPKTRVEVFKFFGLDSQSPEFLSDVYDMMQRRVLSGGVEKEIEQIAMAAKRAESAIGDPGVRAIDDVALLLGKIYQTPDIFVKHIAYTTKLRRLMHAEGVTEATEALKDRAARLTNNTFQSYDFTMPIAKDLSRLPFGPSFITFPIEAIRNHKNLILETLEYMDDAKVAWKAGDKVKARRYAAMAINKAGHQVAGLSLIGFVGRTTARALGFDEEKMAAANELVAFRGGKGDSNTFITGYDADTHELQFLDFSNVNPYPHFAMLARFVDNDTGRDLGQRLDELASEMSAIYAPTGILTKASYEAFTGRSMRSFFDIFKGDTPSFANSKNSPGELPGDYGKTEEGKRMGKKLYRFYRTLAPSMATQGETALRGISGDPIGSRKFSIAGETMYQMTGLRPNDVNLTKSFEYLVRDVRDKAETLRSGWKGAVRDIPESDLKSYAEIRRIKQQELNDLSRYMIYYASVARRMDYSDKEIDKILERIDKGVFNKKFRKAILQGSEPEIDELWGVER